jgi:hypothetical protein
MNKRDEDGTQAANNGEPSTTYRDPVKKTDARKSAMLQRGRESFPRKVCNDPAEHCTGKKRGITHWVSASGLGGLARKMSRKLRRAGGDVISVVPQHPNQRNDFCKCGSGSKGRDCCMHHTPTAANENVLFGVWTRGVNAITLAVAQAKADRAAAAKDPNKVVHVVDLTAAEMQVAGLLKTPTAEALAVAEALTEALAGAEVDANAAVC